MFSHHAHPKTQSSNNTLYYNSTSPDHMQYQTDSQILSEVNYSSKIHIIRHHITIRITTVQPRFAVTDTPVAASPGEEHSGIRRIIRPAIVVKLHTDPNVFASCSSQDTILNNTLYYNSTSQIICQYQTDSQILSEVNYSSKIHIIRHHITIRITTRPTQIRCHDTPLQHPRRGSTRVFEDY